MRSGPGISRLCLVGKGGRLSFSKDGAGPKLITRAILSGNAVAARQVGRRQHRAQRLALGRSHTAGRAQHLPAFQWVCQNALPAPSARSQ